MQCRICGEKMRETHGAHFIDGRWVLLRAFYCGKHGSYVDKYDVAAVGTTVPDATKRCHIRPGLHVLVVLKKDQSTNTLTEGYVDCILTHSLVHTRGIKVRLTDGRVGRVRKILRKDETTWASD